MENNEFLKSLEKGKTDHYSIFKVLWDGVIDTNKLIGLDKELMSPEELDSLIDTYRQLCHEEGKEFKVAVAAQDKVEMLDALIDYFVVGGYLHHIRGYDFEDLWRRWVDYDDITFPAEYFEVAVDNKEWQTALYWMLAILKSIDIDYNLAVETVLHTNLSKFPTTAELSEAFMGEGIVGVSDNILIQVQVERIEGKGRYGGVTCEKVLDKEEETRLVFWSTTEYGIPKRKYLKPVTFVQPNFQQCWNK